MYNVAFVYTRAAGGFEGVRTWSSFKSKKDFDAWYTSEIKEREKVVEEGISVERCVQLINETPRACYIAAAVEKSTDPQTGEVNLAMLDMELTTAIMASKA